MKLTNLVILEFKVVRSVEDGTCAEENVKVPTPDIHSKDIIWAVSLYKFANVVVKQVHIHVNKGGLFTALTSLYSTSFISRRHVGKFHNTVAGGYSSVGYHKPPLVNTQYLDCIIHC